MPAPSKFDLMDERDREELDRRIIAQGFAGYVALSEWLSEQGYEIGKTAVGLRGQNLKRKLQAIRASTEAAKMIAAAAPDETDERSNAIISLVQTEMFEALVQLQEAASEDDHAVRIETLGKAAKHIATLTRASVNRNKWAAEVRQQALLDAANRVESAAQARGLGVDDVRYWREQVLMGM